MSAEKWAVRKVRGYWTVIPPVGKKLHGYVRDPDGYPFGKTPAGFTLACGVLRAHLDRGRI